MPLEARLLVGLAVAVAVVQLTLPLAIKVATRLEFFDRPVGYKAHAAPTPYLGGAAVVGGFIVAVLLLGGSWDKTVPLLSGVVVLWAVGTIDDRRTVLPRTRVAIEVALGAGLWALDLGWDLGRGWLLDLVISVFWVVAVVNAFNLFDNMDGAASSMAAVVAAGLALLGVVEGNTWLAVTAAALCGAAIGFLPHNLLASPARIFLGDGGSMPVGFAVAAVTMIGVGGAAPAWQSLAMGLLFVGIPALDTTLVMVSRRRRGLSFLTGGRDHLTHRAFQRLRTARAVAVALGCAQAVVSALAIVALRGGSATTTVAVAAYLLGLGVTITLLDARFSPSTTTPITAGQAHTPAQRPAIDRLSAILLVAVGAGLGLSPFFFGYYSSSIWAPAGLALLGVATAGLIARPPPLRLPAGMLLAGLGGVGVWALASGAWADSIEQAVVEGNRWLALCALVLVLLVLVRSAPSALVLLGAIGLGCLAVALTVLVRMLTGDPADLFLGGRLDAPLGYINGLASFFLLGTWLCVAAGERRHPLIAALGAAGATLMAGLVVMSQSRGVAVAAAVSLLLVVAVVPGRTRRGWLVVVVGSALALASSALLDVFASAGGGAPPERVVQRAAEHLALATALAGIAWGFGVWAAAAGWRESATRRLAAGALIVLVVAMMAAGALSAGSIADTLERQYNAFIHLTIEPQGSATANSRLVSGTGNRYDYWRVAWRAFRDEPVAGVGAGNYDGPYFAHRTTTEDIRQPHSIELQLLSELGVVGLALLAIALAGIVVGARHSVPVARTSRAERTVVVAALGMVSAWLVHTSVDWIHLLPGVAGMALAGAVCLVRAGTRSEPAPKPRGALPTVAVPLTVALALAIAAVSLSRQALAEHFRSNAEATLKRDPATALREADRALRLDPESVPAYYAKAAALARFNQATPARNALLEAARREPGDFVTWALLGDLAVRAGDLDEAARRYRHALRLNPRDMSLREHARDPAASLPGN